MKEIGFRGKIRNEYTEEWFYGDLLQDTEGKMYIVTKNYTPKPDGSIELNTCQSPQVDPETVGQYTGLKDKNGVKIYNGDIVAINFLRATKRGKAVIKYENKYAGFVLTQTVDKIHEYESLGDYQMENVEVIGNIHDNSEVLEDNK